MMSMAMGTRQGRAKAGDLKTLCAMSRSDARTTNLLGDVVSGPEACVRRWPAHLWKTEMQLSGPLANWAT